MANAFKVIDAVTRRATLAFKNNLVLGALVDRQWDSQVSEAGTGTDIRIRRPVEFEAGTTADITSTQTDIEEGNLTLSLNFRRTVSFNATSEDLSLNIQDFDTRYTMPAMKRLAQKVESSLFGEYDKIYSFTGTPGTTPSTALEVATAGANMTEAGVPKGDRFALYTPLATVKIADSLKALNLPTVARTALEDARINRLGDMDIYESASIPTHTTGVHTTGSTTPLTNGTTAVTYLSSKDTYTMSLVTDGWALSTAIFTAGDQFTIAGCNSVNLETKVDTGNLQVFTCTAASSSDGSGDMTTTVSPPVIVSGPYQNVAAEPGDGAAIVPKGTESTAYPQNLAMHKNAMTLAFAPLAMPVDGTMAARHSLDGVSVRLAAAHNILTDVNTWRFDVLYGIKVQNPGFAVRHWG